MPYSNINANAVVDCWGDSITLSLGVFGVQADQYWPARLAARFQFQGYAISERNGGVSGDTSYNLMARMSDWGQLPPAKAAAIFIGANDPASPISTTQTQYNIQAIIKCALWLVNYRAPRYPYQVVATPSALPASVVGYRAWVNNDNDTTGGFTPSVSGNILNSGNSITAIWECKVAATSGVAGWGRVAIGQCFFGSQTNLPSGAKPGMRAVVLNDTSTTGGAVSTFVSTTPIIIGSVATTPAQSVWECRTSGAGETGWGRIAVSGTPNNYLGSAMIVLSMLYLNFTAAGDTLGVPYSVYLNVRNAQIAAAAAEAVPYGDFYNYYRNLVVAGTQANYFGGAYDRTKGPHVADQNQHLSELGHDYVAEFIYGLVGPQRQFDWTPGLNPTAVGV